MIAFLVWLGNKKENNCFLIRYLNLKREAGFDNIGLTKNVDANVLKENPERFLGLIVIGE